MKNRILFLIIILFLPFIGQSQILKFKKTKYKFGFVHEGEVVTMNFEYFNTGDKPLVISDYKVECGCTVMEKPSQPIPPGGKGILKITFDTHEKYDRQDRTVEVISNSIQQPVILRFKGVVLKAKSRD
jgi:hypothetical protein